MNANDKTQDLTTETQAAALLAQKPFVEVVEGVPIIFLPIIGGGWDFHEQSQLLDRPLRKKGTVWIHDAESFCTYIKRHGSLGNTTLYLEVDYENGKIRGSAIFNDDGDEGNPAGWRDHRAVFMPNMTEEWKRWTGMNGKALDQVKFAHFIEDNIQDIVAEPDSKMPTGSDMLTFVTKLEETRKVKYGNGVNLQNGMVQIEFTEDNDTATKGKLDLYREFTIGISPFLNGVRYKLHAHLRYRIDRNTGAIAFWYDLHRPDRIIEDASKAVIDYIKSSTGVLTIYGTP